MKNNYEIYYKNLISNIEGLAENPDRLSVPELLDELSELVICNRNLILNNEIEEAFRYHLNSINSLFINYSESSALAKIKDIFNFDSKIKFIDAFHYHDDIMNFFDEHFDKITYIMNYLNNRVESIIADNRFYSIIADNTSDDLSEADIAEIKAAIDEDDADEQNN